MTATAAAPLAFGFRLDGVRSPALIEARQPDWPALHIRHRIAPAVAQPSHHGEADAWLSLGGQAWLSLDRHCGTATYLTPRGLDEDRLIHPWLAPAAGLMARWLGREVFHAGAFLAGGGAWALVGSNQAGKSTLLSALAMAGTPVLTDDLLVVDEGVAYAGPRCLDLRQPHGVGRVPVDLVRTVREGSRHRLDLPAVEAAAPLRGWFFLEWGSEVEAAPSRAPARLRRLVAQRRWATDALDPCVLLELASLPAWTLRRPRGSHHTDAVLERLHELTGHCRPGGGRDRPTCRRPELV